MDLPGETTLCISKQHQLSQSNVRLECSRPPSKEMEVKETRSEFPHLVALLRGAVEKDHENESAHGIGLFWKIKISFEYLKVVKM